MVGHAFDGYTSFLHSCKLSNFTMGSWGLLKTINSVKSPKYGFERVLVGRKHFKTIKNEFYKYEIAGFFGKSNFKDVSDEDLNLDHDNTRTLY